MSTVVETDGRRVRGLGRQAYLSVVAPAVLFVAVPVLGTSLRLALQDGARRWTFPSSSSVLWLALAIVFGAVSYGVVAAVEASRDLRGSGTLAATAAGLGLGVVIGGVTWWLSTDVRALLPENAFFWVVAITVYVIAIVRTRVRD